MINRRTFSAAVGAVALGLFSRIRFAPSAGGPRGRRLRGKRVAWGDYEFCLPADVDVMTVDFRGERMTFVGTDANGFHRYQWASGDHATVVDVKRRFDDSVGVSMVACYNKSDDEFMVATGSFDPLNAGAGSVVFMPSWPEPQGVAGFDDFDRVLSGFRMNYSLA